MPTFNNMVNTGNKIEKYRSGFQLIIAGILAIFLVPLSLYGIFRKRRYDMQTKGIVLSVSEKKCDTDCDTHYNYTVNNETYNGSALGVFVEGTEIPVYYNPETPSESGLKAGDTLTAQVTGYVTYLKHKNNLHSGCRRYTVPTKTTVKRNGVSRTTYKDVSRYDCYITYEYMVKEKRYIQTSRRNTGTQYNTGSEIDVYYESKNPENTTFNPDDFRMFGAIASSVVCLVIVGLVSQYLIVSKVKGVGSVMLASRVMNGKGIL